MTSSTDTNAGTLVFRVYIRATPEAIWEAITKPDWTEKYGYGGRGEFVPDTRPGARYQASTNPEMRAMGAPDLAIDGEVIEADPPKKLVQTWRMVMDPESAVEGFTRLTHEISSGADGVSRLTLTHELEHAPRVALLISGQLEEMGAGGGWSWVLSDLKSLLETGKRMAG